MEHTETFDRHITQNEQRKFLIQTFKAWSNNILKNLLIYKPRITVARQARVEEQETLSQEEQDSCLSSLLLTV